MSVHIESARRRVSTRRQPKRATARVPLLFNGDRLNADEFLRRYEAMPQIRKAELIKGIVYIEDLPAKVYDGCDDDIPPLANGDTLTTREFLRRYTAMPNLKKAELIGGIVFTMASPVRYKLHAKPDGLMHTVLGAYAIETPGVEFAANATVCLDEGYTFQPDGLLRKLAKKGGKTKIDSDDYIVGSPELIVEIAASSAALDTNGKMDACRAKGVQEYAVWMTEQKAFKWWHLEAGEYRLLAADKSGIVKSRVFPGFWLDVKALMSGDGMQLMKVLRRGLKSKAHAAFLR